MFNERNFGKKYVTAHKVPQSRIKKNEKNLILLFEMHRPWNTAATTKVSAFGNPRAKQTKSLHVPARNIRGKVRYQALQMLERSRFQEILSHSCLDLLYC